MQHVRTGRLFVSWFFVSLVSLPLLCGAMGVCGLLSEVIRASAAVRLCAILPVVTLLLLPARMLRPAGSALSAFVLVGGWWLCGWFLTGLVAPLNLPVSSLVVCTLVSGIAGAGCHTMAKRLPQRIDTLEGMSRLVACLWVCVALLSVVQCARLSTFMLDPGRTEAAVLPFDPQTTQHQALAAYIRGAELDRSGEMNIYDRELYPSSASGPVTVSSEVANLSPSIEQPFQYPPPFVLLPRTALALSSDYIQIRAVWFWVNCWLLLSAFGLSCRWVGGRRGLSLALGLPVLWLALPTALTLQFGQFHLAAISLTIIGLVAVNSGRERTAGLLFGVATAAKLFPAVALVYLGVRGRWRSCVYAIGGICLLGGLTWAVSGPAIFEAFVGEQLPRLSSGSHVSFEETGTFSTFNVSVFGLVHRLRQLGIDGLHRVHAVGANWAFSLILFSGVLWVGRRQRERSAELALWLGILCLAAFRAPLAPATYITAPAIWLLTVSAVARSGRFEVTLWGVLAWLFLHPIAPAGNPQVLIVASFACPVVLLWLALVSFRRPRSQLSS